MNIRFSVLTTAILFIFFSRFSFSEQKDFEYRSGVKLSLGINKDWDFKFAEEFRLNDDGGNLYYHHSDFGFIYKGFADWVDFGFNFRKIYQQSDDDEWIQENRPHINIKFKGKPFGLDISDNSRFEFRDRENKKDVWRYRNKFTIKFPEKLAPAKVKPYVADEVFVDLYGDRITKNRLYAGFSFKMTDNMSCEFYYLWQTSRNGSGWDGIHAIGTHLALSF